MHKLNTSNLLVEELGLTKTDLTRQTKAIDLLAQTQILGGNGAEDLGGTQSVGTDSYDRFYGKAFINQTEITGAPTQTNWGAEVGFEFRF